MGADFTRRFLVELGLDSKDAEKGADTAERSFTELNQALEVMGKVTGVAKAAFDTLAKGLDRARQVEGVKNAFITLQNEAGLLAGKSLAELSEATKSLVSDFDLMSAANTAVNLGLDPSKFDELAAAATKVGASMGVDALTAIESVSFGLGRQSVQVLDNLGVIVKAEIAYKEYANTHKIVGRELDANEKRIAFQTEAIKQLTAKAASLNDIQMTAGQAASALGEKWKNLTDRFWLGVSGSESLTAALNAAAEILGDSADPAEALGEVLGDLLGWILQIVVELNNFINMLQEWSHEMEVGIAVTKLFIAEQTNFFGSNQDVVDSLKAEVVALATGREEFRGLAERDIPKVIEKKKQLTEGTKKLTSAEKKAVTETKKLKEEWAKLVAGIEEKNIAKAVEQSIDDLNQLDFEIALGDLEEAVYQRSLEGFKKYLKGAATAAEIDALAIAQSVAASDSWREKMGEAVDDVNEKAMEASAESAEKAAEELKDAYKESTEFYEDILREAFEGNIKDFINKTLQNAAYKFGAQILASMTSNFTGFDVGSLFGGGGGAGGLGGIGEMLGLGSLFSGGAAGGGIPGLQGGAPLVGGEIAGGMGAFTGAGIMAAIAATVSSGISFGGDIAAGEKPSFGDSAILAPVTGGLSLIPQIFTGLFGGGDAIGDQRNQIFDQIAQAGLGENLQINTAAGESTSLFDIDFGSILADLENVTPLMENAIGLTQGLATVLSGGEQKEAFNVIFGSAVQEDAKTYGEILLNTMSFMQDIGLTAEEGKQQLQALFLEGAISLDEFQAGIMNFNEVASGSFGDVNETLDLFISTMQTDPKLALQVFEGVMKEMEGVGIDTFSEMGDFVSDRFGPEVAAAFRELASRGIDSVGDLRFDSVDHIAALFNAFEGLKTDTVSEMDSLASDVATKIPDAFEKAARDAATEFNAGIGDIWDDLDKTSEKAKRAADRLKKIGRKRSGTRAVTDPNEGLNENSA